MNILIYHANAFPYGRAATNRVINLAKVLIAGNINVKVVCLRPTESPDNMINTQLSGKYDSIEFFYASSSLIWPRYKLKKLLIIYISAIKALIKTSKIKKKKKVDIIILNAYYNFINTFFISLYCKWNNIKLIYAVDEYPMLILRPKWYKLLYKNFYTNTFYKFFDGFIVISKTLINYYRKKAQKKSLFFHLPMTVETERFNYDKKEVENKIINITYCGSDNNKDVDKDGVEILIRAFYIINEKYNNTYLNIIGPTNKRRIDLVNKLELDNHVNFKGLINREKMPNELQSASMLVLARPCSLRAEGGFPTKLGEYLATGNPVLVTRVGEINDYLIDKENAFLAKPNNIEDFARKMAYIINNPKIAKDVGQKGKKLANTVFSYQTYINSLKIYLESFLTI